MFWKIYAWLLAVVLAATYGALIWEGLEVREAMDIPISLVAVIGVFGYAYKRRIVSEDLWRVWFFVIIGWDIYNNLVLDDFTEFGGEILIAIIIMLILIIPTYIALFLYGFKSEALWKPQKRI